MIIKNITTSSDDDEAKVSIMISGGVGVYTTRYYYL